MGWIKLHGQHYSLVPRKMPLHFARSMAGSMLFENLKCAGQAEAGDMLAMEITSGDQHAGWLCILSTPSFFKCEQSAHKEPTNS